MTWSIHGVNFIVVQPALHDVSQTNEKNTPNIWLFLQSKIFGTKFGSFCTIQKRFEQNWIKNSIAVRVYFWTFFDNLDFPNSALAPLCIDRLALKWMRFVTLRTTAGIQRTRRTVESSQWQTLRWYSSDIFSTGIIWFILKSLQWQSFGWHIVLQFLSKMAIRTSEGLLKTLIPWLGGWLTRISVECF